MDNFEEKQSKYGKIFKVAGPRKQQAKFEHQAYRDPSPRFMRGEV